MDPKERQRKAVRVAMETAAEQVYVAWNTQEREDYRNLLSGRTLFLTCASTLTMNVVWSHMVIISSMLVDAEVLGVGSYFWMSLSDVQCLLTDPRFPRFSSLARLHLVNADWGLIRTRTAAPDTSGLICRWVQEATSREDSVIHVKIRLMIRKGIILLNRFSWTSLKRILKGIVHLKMKILSLIAHSYVVPTP